MPRTAGGASKRAASAPANPLDSALAKDLRAAKSIAEQVAGRMEAAARASRPRQPRRWQSVAEAPQTVDDRDGERPRRTSSTRKCPFGSIIYKEAKKNNVRPELVAAVVQAESRFKPTARSGAGAIGLMQLVPRTGRWMGARDLTNPAQNIAAGAKYLSYLSDRFDGNETKIIAAYNAGEGNVKRFDGVPPFRETRNLRHQGAELRSRSSRTASTAHADAWASANRRDGRNAR